MLSTTRLRTLKARMILVALAPSAVILLGAAAAAPAPAGLDFAGMSLGMTLQAWKAAPIPGSPSPGIQPVCSDHPIGTGLIAAARQADITVCTYQKRYGRFSLPQAIALGPKVQAKQMRFTFTGGRLTGINYQTSVDVFSDLTARLTKRYGPPAKLVRDNIKTELGSFPRVRETWNTPRGLIQLVDPVPSLGAMSVGLVAKLGSAARAS